MSVLGGHSLDCSCTRPAASQQLQVITPLYISQSLIWIQRGIDLLWKIKFLIVTLLVPKRKLSTWFVLVILRTVRKLASSSLFHCVDLHENQGTSPWHGYIHWVVNSQVVNFFNISDSFFYNSAIFLWTVAYYGNVCVSHLFNSSIKFLHLKLIFDDNICNASNFLKFAFLLKLWHAGQAKFTAVSPLTLQLKDGLLLPTIPLTNCTTRMFLLYVSDCRTKITILWSFP